MFKIFVLKGNAIFIEQMVIVRYTVKSERFGGVYIFIHSGVV
jgi:hypothetical protein